MRRTGYRFLTRIESAVVDGGIYVWQSRSQVPNDSRVEEIRCPARWFWAAPTLESQVSPMTPALSAWMAGGDVDNDREEARSAALAAERDRELHPAACRCRECCADELSAEDWR